MKCPEHPDEDLRVEYTSASRTGFCHSCLKHHALCTAVRYMTMCDRLRAHEGPHRDKDGQEWTPDHPGHMGGR
jgi:hypothetical protein